MRRITSTVPEALAAELLRQAHRRRVSASEIVREALAEFLGVAEGRVAALPWIGMIDNPDTIVADRIDDVLEKEWADAITRHRG